MSNERAASLFITDDMVIDLSKVAFVRMKYPIAYQNDVPIEHATLIYLSGIHGSASESLRIFDEEQTQSFLAALSTYHELYVSPRK